MNETRSSIRAADEQHVMARAAERLRRSREQLVVIAERQVAHIGTADIPEAFEIRRPGRENGVVLGQRPQVPGRPHRRVPGIVGRVVETGDAHAAQPAQRRAGQRRRPGGDQEGRPRLGAARDHVGRKRIETRRPVPAEAPQSRSHQPVRAYCAVRIEPDHGHSPSRGGAFEAPPDMRPRESADDRQPVAPASGGPPVRDSISGAAHFAAAAPEASPPHGTAVRRTATPTAASAAASPASHSA